MVIKATPQILKRISVRWLPEDAYENTDTIALNVGGYFMDLRIVTANQSLEWSRAGERKSTAGKEPSAFQWTRIIDSFGSKQTDEATFTSLPNGDDLETGTFSKDGTPTAYEEVWRDVTEDLGGKGPSWIIQTSDNATFLGKIGHMFLGMRQDQQGRFAVRREVFDALNKSWMMVFESSAAPALDIPRAVDVVPMMDRAGTRGVAGSRVREQGGDYVILGYH